VVEMHHIREWAVYQTHDAGHMIVLSPTCHAAVSRGSLRLSDEMLYDWKSALPQRWAAVNVPPAGLQKLLLGSVAVTSEYPFAEFDPDSFQSLSFHLDVDGTVLSLSADVSDQDGNRLLTMYRNTVRYVHGSVELEQRPGGVRAVAADWSPFCHTGLSDSSTTATSGSRSLKDYLSLTSKWSGAASSASRECGPPAWGQS